MNIDDISARQIGFFTGTRDWHGTDLLYLPHSDSSFSELEIDSFFEYIVGIIGRGAYLPPFLIVVDNTRLNYPDDSHLLQTIQKYCGNKVSKVYIIEKEKYDEMHFSFEIVRTTTNEMQKILANEGFDSSFLLSAHKDMDRWTDIRKRIDHFNGNVQKSVHCSDLSQKSGFLECFDIIKRIEVDEDGQKITKIPLDQQMSNEYISKVIKSPSEVTQKLNCLRKRVEEIELEETDAHGLELALEECEELERNAKELDKECGTVIGNKNSLDQIKGLIEDNIRHISDCLFLSNLEKMCDFKEDYSLDDLALKFIQSDLARKFRELDERLNEIEKCKRQLKFMENEVKEGISDSKVTSVKDRIQTCVHKIENLSGKTEQERNHLLTLVLINYIEQDVESTIERLHSLGGVHLHNQYYDADKAREHYSLLLNTGQKTYEYGEMSLRIMGILVTRVGMTQDKVLQLSQQLKDLWEIILPQFSPIQLLV